MTEEYKNDLDELVKVSKILGSRIDYIQGAGGNISVKLDNTLMAIKASGYLLKNLSYDHGFSYINYVALRNYLQNPDNTEEAFNKKLKQFNQECHGQCLRPSIEVGFHGVLKAKYIIHTHNVYANILTCSKEGKSIIANLFTNSLWIPYVTVGLDLAVLCKNMLAQTTQEPKVIFLQNHGLIVSGNNIQEAYDLHEKVSNKIINHFNLFSFVIGKYILSLEYMRKNILFPDQVVYTLGDEFLNTDPAKETLSSYRYIIDNIIKLGLTPNLMKQEDIDTIANMESEKYRKSLIMN